MSKTVLILGASGRFGRNAADAFDAAGWVVSTFRRGEDLIKASQGVDVIVNAWNPPYDQWAKTVPGLTREVIAAAKSSGATVIIPGNVYVFGANGPGTWDETTPHSARNTLGMVRKELEAAYRDAGVRTIILRAGDFLDIEPSGNWFDGVITKNWSKGVFNYPGPLDRPHAWAFLPDITRAAVALADMRDALPEFADIPFPGYTLTGQQLMDLVSAATGVDQRHRQFPWPLIGALRPFWKLARGIWEMRYLWSTPHSLSGRTFDRLVPDFQTTAPKVAVGLALNLNVDPHKAVVGGSGDQGSEIAV